MGAQSVGETLHSERTPYSRGKLNPPRLPLCFKALAAARGNVLRRELVLLNRCCSLEVLGLLSANAPLTDTKYKDYRHWPIGQKRRATVRTGRAVMEHHDPKP